MKFTIGVALAAASLATASFADGDAAEGEKTFRKCKSCHMIESPAGDTIVKGGKTGPNLFGVIGRTAGTYDGFNYGDSLVEAGEKGLVWDAETLASYVQDPKAFLVEYTGDSGARSKMSFKLNDDYDDVAAYLAQFPAE